MTNDSWAKEGPEQELQAALVDIKKIAMGGCGSRVCRYQRGAAQHDCRCNKWLTAVLTTLVKGVTE